MNSVRLQTQMMPDTKQVQADALLISLNPDRVHTWLQRNGYQPTIPNGSDPNLARRAYFVQLFEDVPLRETLQGDRPEARLEVRKACPHHSQSRAYLPFADLQLLEEWGEIPCGKLKIAKSVVILRLFKTAPRTLALCQGSRCFWKSTRPHWQIPKMTGRGLVKMVWAFSLSAECGADQVAAEQFAQHFDGLSWELSNGLESQCHTAVFQDIEENWWCQVRPSGISEVGIGRSDIAYQMTELGILLYQRLQSAPTFRYALVGVEVDEFRTYRELISEAAVPSFPGLALAETVWRSLGASTLFRPFSPGYVWQPYEGEVYKPLMVSPDLKNKLSELLVLQ